MATDDSSLRCCVCEKLLTEPPLLLGCFHPCCEKCSESITDSKQVKLTCPACAHSTMISDARTCYFIAAQVRAFKISSGNLKCELCANESISDPPEAEEWCDICWKTLCEKCTVNHGYIHPDHPTDELAKDLERCLTAPQVCQLHRKVSEHICITCEMAGCSTCLQRCLEDRHTVEVHESSGAGDFVLEIKERINERQRALQDDAENLNQLQAVSDRIENERSSILCQLKSNKLAIVQAVEKAYENAEASLDEACSKALQSLSRGFDPHQLSQRAHHLQRYSETLVQKADVISLLSQQKMLLSAMQSLSQQLASMKVPVNTNQFLRVESSVPDNLDDVLRQWIGAPHAIEVGQGGDVSLEVGSKTPDDSSNSFADTLSFDARSKSFVTSTPCYDLSTTRDGNILLALGDQGMHECDPDGATLSTWKPDKKLYNGDDDRVIAVDTLEDGRVVVGLRHRWWLVLLRRREDGFAGSPWRIDKCITSLAAHPKRLSAQSDLLAVAEWPSTLVLVSIDSSAQVVLRRQLEYFISAVALADLVVITASSAPVATGGRREQHVVDAHNRRGERLWRQACDDWVQDIAVSPSKQVLYLAMYSGKRVTAVMRKDGSHVADVLSSASHAIESPIRLSLEKTRGSALALLSVNGKNVSVFSTSITGCSTSCSVQQ